MAARNNRLAEFNSGPPPPGVLQWLMSKANLGFKPVQKMPAISRLPGFRPENAGLRRALMRSHWRRPQRPVDDIFLESVIKNCCPP
jgi:hypothetical protein